MSHPSNEFLAFQEALAGEYSLQRELGRGGMGIVYLARDVQLDRNVAIKVLPSHLASRESRDRFLREARTAAGLSHPHIVPIHRVGEAGGFVFFVMSYVEGETLGDRLRNGGPLPPAEVTRIMREVAWALAYAHGRGIVHRDVKPDNILLEAATGRALVTDFGIAHGGALGPDTDPDQIMGTAHFMSPEQAANSAFDGRSDIYGLGVVGYLAASGRLPFEAPSVPALLLKQATDVPPRVASIAPGIPPALSAAIDRCLARDPDARFVDGEALAAALAPTTEVRPALAPTLRAWLGAQNPLALPYLAWSTGLSALAVGNTMAWFGGNPEAGGIDVVLLLGGASAPLLPILGYHLNQARRQFRAGHSLSDLRSAIKIEKRERAESDAVKLDEKEALTHRLVRAATLGSSAWLAGTMGRVIIGSITEQQLGFFFIVVPILATMFFGALSNALGVQFIPAKLRNWWRSGIRDRLWNSSAGEWLARRLGAPEQSQRIDGGVFRPTESALGVAAVELFSALPESYREELGELPATVAALEAHAAAARAEIDIVASLVPSASGDAAVLEKRRAAAGAHLAESVAALEKIRLDLLRLHAGASDLAPLTTLIQNAQLVNEQLSRLADAQLEVDEMLERIPTPR